MSLPERDAVLDPGAAAVTQLELGDVAGVLVGEKARVAVAVLVKDLKLRAGVRTLAAADQPRTLGPCRQVDPVSQLSDPRAVAIGTASVERLHPHRFRDLKDR